MNTKVEEVSGDDANVGFSGVLPKKTFDKLVKMSGGKTATMHSWSTTLVRLIDKA